MQQTPTLIRRLAEASVDFIIVGGVAAIAHGATTFTRHLDVTIPFNQENLDRLLEAVSSLSPRHALTPERPPLEQDAAKLATYRNLYLETDMGRLDVLGNLPLGDYEDIRARRGRGISRPRSSSP